MNKPGFMCLSQKMNPIAQFSIFYDFWIYVNKGISKKQQLGLLGASTDIQVESEKIGN